jgi:hypothetical protein
VDSSKILKVGFTPLWSVEKAIEGIVDMYRSGALVEEDRCINLKWMRMHGWVSA